MSANVETMFYTREPVWHGLGVKVQNAPTSEEALNLAGLDWEVHQNDIYVNNMPVPGYKANVRDTDQSILGIVSNRYKVVQNKEAFSFTDELLGGGNILYETAGSLSLGKRVWILARLPKEYIINGEEITPYLVFTNTHDGSGSIRAAITPVRVCCQNTLNLALRTAQRSWSAVHTQNIFNKMDEARNTLLLASKYMVELSREFENLHKIRMSDDKFINVVEKVIPIDESMTDNIKKNQKKLQDDVIFRYFYAPDLEPLEKDAYRVINAFSDFATHMEPLRKTENYRENLFSKTIDGHPVIDKVYRLLQAA